MTKHPSDRRVALDAAVALHHQQYAVQVHHGDLDSADADVLATASTIFGWLTGSAEHDPVIIGLTERIASLEDRMAKTETALEDLNDATNEVAAELDQLRGEISATDTALADRIGSAATRLRGLAADPANPVPDPVEPV